MSRLLTVEAARILLRLENSTAQDVATTLYSGGADHFELQKASIARKATRVRRE